MHDKKQAVRDTTISAVGAAIGTAVGTLASPEIALVGGVAGSVGALLAANFAPAFFDDTVVTRYLNNRKILQLLHEKIDADFRYSSVESRGSFEVATESARDTVNTASKAEPSIGTFESRLAREFTWEVDSDNPSAEDVKRHLVQLGAYCRTNGHIRIACPAICAAPVAVLRDIQKRLFERVGLSFDISAQEINGRDFFASLKRSCEVDFAVGPLEALVLCDPSRKLPLRVLGPLFQERQWIFVTKKKGIGMTAGVWVFSRSSAEMQYLVGLDLKTPSERKTIHDARQIPTLVESIPPGDMVIAWEPLSNVLSRSRDFEVVPRSDYMVHFVLLAHRNHVTRRRPSGFPINSFLTVFLAEWRRFQNDHRTLTETLRKDHDYMKAFAAGCGHRWTHEI